MVLAAALLATLAVVTPTGSAEEDAALPAWLTPALTYDGSALSNLRGGARTGSTYIGNLHLKLTALGDAAHLPGVTVFLDVLTIHGGRPSSLVGDAQGTINLEGPTGTQVEELWVQYNFEGSRSSVLVGIYDLNSEFYRLNAAGLFLNSSFGIGPEFAQSGVEGPSIFPRTAAGIRVAHKPSANTVLRAAVLDGVPVVRPDGSRGAFRAGDGLLGVAELAMLTRAEPGSAVPTSARDRIGRFSSLAPYDDKLAFGAWHYTGDYADLSATGAAGKPILRHGSSGAYVIGERLLIGRGAADGKRLAAFAQAGFADARTNRFGSYLGTGIVGTGWGLFRDTDQFGLSVAHARNGSHYLRSQAPQAVDRAETTLELSYLTQVTKHLTIQPDLQVVIHPNTDPSIAAAWVLQLRFEIAF